MVPSSDPESNSEKGAGAAPWSDFDDDQDDGKTFNEMQERLRRMVLQCNEDRQLRPDPFQSPR